MKREKQSLCCHLRRAVWSGGCVAVAVLGPTGVAFPEGMRRVSENTPLVIEGGVDAPQISEIPLPPLTIPDENRETAARSAAANLEAMLGDVETLTGIFEEGFDISPEFPTEAALPLFEKTRYSEGSIQRSMTTEVQR